MFGVMDNNMGFHKERLSLRPTTSHPEIKTDGSMFEFVFSSFYSMSSRSILVFVRGVLSTFESFTTRFASRFTEISDTSYSYNTVSSLALVFGNVINVLVSFFYNLINVLTLNLTAFSFTNKLVDLQMSLSYLITLNTFFGLTDFSFGT